jgi:hypothetical protein
MKSTRLVIAIISLVVVIGGGAAFMMYRNHYGPLAFTLTFKDAKQLRPGQFVIYKGVRVGEVKNVQLNNAGMIEVAVVLDSDHRMQVCAESTFRIEKPSLLDLSGEHQVTVSDNEATCTPIVRGSVLQGSEGMFDDLVKRGKALVQ